MVERPRTIAVLAATADGKIADRWRSPARFGSKADKLHLERQIALSDGVLFGRGTLSAYQTTLPVRDRQLQQQRLDRGKPPQPIYIVCSHSADFDPQWRFFQQPIPRWLISSAEGAKLWQDSDRFERIIVTTSRQHWQESFKKLYDLGVYRLAILGGGETIASLLAVDLIDEFWLTICPLMVCGRDAPTIADGLGVTSDSAKKLQLLSAEVIKGEVFLHYTFRDRKKSSMKQPCPIAKGVWQ